MRNLLSLMENHDESIDSKVFSVLLRYMHMVGAMNDLPFKTMFPRLDDDVLSDAIAELYPNERQPIYAAIRTKIKIVG